MSVVYRVSNLTIRRGRGTEPAIGPLSFEVEAGSAIGIVGETGAGKTLALRALMGLLPTGLRMDGTVQLGEGGMPLVDEMGLRGELGRQIGVVLQNPYTAFDPLKSVGAQLIEGVVRRHLQSKWLARERAKVLLVSMGFRDVDDVLRLYPSQLSGGMAQRIAIAIAMMPEPRVLLADEPTSALDATLRIGVLQLLRHFTTTSGAVLVMVSHDLGLVAEFCEQLIVMYGGRAIEMGSASELLEHPRHPYTQALIACTPRVGRSGRRRLASIPGSAVSPFANGRGCRYASRCPLVIDICRTEEPTLTVSGSASVACHVAQRASAYRG